MKDEGKKTPRARKPRKRREDQVTPPAMIDPEADWKPEPRNLNHEPIAPAETPPKSEGLICSRCGCRHFLVWSTRRQANRIRRVRICRHCGKRMVTFER